MSKLRAHNIAMSVDGYMAGPDQSLENPLGRGGPPLHEWVFATRTGAEMIGAGGGELGLDDDMLAAGFENIGAWILGRNMFGPVRGPWPDESWNGWWGTSPPYHCDVFVLTHHARPTVEMEGGTTFHFVTEGIEVARERALAAADGLDVRIGGGASTLQSYLRTGLLDELHVAIVPVLLGAGERLFDHLDGGPDGYECVEHLPSAAVTHVRFAKT
jgi:dihydrofolate reductase